MKASEEQAATGGVTAPLKVAICGAGAMGVLFGTTLIKGGNSVTFYDGWQALLDAMKDRTSAIVRTAEGEEEVPVTVKPLDSSKDETGPVDLVMITVKSPMTRDTIRCAVEKGLIGPETIVLTLQGGFDNVDVISELIEDKTRLLYGRTCCSCKAAGFMTIENFALAATTVWALGTAKGEEPSPRAKDVVERVNNSGLPFELTDKAIADRWMMLLYYPTNIAVSAINGLNFKDAWEDEGSRKVLIGLAKECAKVAALEGVDTTEFNEEIAIAAVKKLAEEECPKHMGSMHADIGNKRVTENEATLGALLKFGTKHGIELPYTDVIHGLLHSIEQNYDKRQ